MIRSVLLPPDGSKSRIVLKLTNIRCWQLVQACRYTDTDCKHHLSYVTKRPQVCNDKGFTVTKQYCRFCRERPHN